MRVLMLLLLCQGMLVAHEAKDAEVASPKAEAKRFFPSGVMSAEDEARYAEYFKRFNEEPIYHLASPAKKGQEGSDDEVHLYRLLWTRAFHPPVLITLETASKNRSGFINIKKLRMEDSPSGKVIKWLTNSRFMIAEGESRNIETLFYDAGFWKLPMENPIWSGALDGSGWLIEAVSGDQYHVVSRANILAIPPARLLEEAKFSPQRLLQEAMLATGCVSLIFLSNESDEKLY